VSVRVGVCLCVEYVGEWICRVYFTFSCAIQESIKVPAICHACARDVS
jgi:hypothetical protein